MRPITLFFSVLTTCLLYGQVPAFEWGTVFKGHGDVRVGGVLLDGSGDGCVASGSFSEDLFLPHDTLVKWDGYSDHVIVRLNYLGTILWTIQVSEQIRSVRSSANGNVIAIASYTDSCMVGDQVVHASGVGISFVGFVISSTGDISNVQNHPNVVRAFDGEFNSVSAVTDTDLWGIHLTGRFNDSLRVADTTLYGGEGSVYVAKFTDGFERQWARRLGIATAQYSLPVDELGNIFYTAEDPMWTPEDTTLGFSGSGLLCLASTGDFRWRFDTPDVPWSPSATVLASNEIFFQSNYAEGSPTVWNHLHKINTEGEVVWTTTYTTEGDARLIPALHPIGGYLMSGTFHGDVTYPGCTHQRGAPTQTIMKWDDNGECEWSRVVTGGNIWGGRTVSDPAGRIYTSGIFEFSVHLETDTFHWTPGRFASYIGALSTLPLGTGQNATKTELSISPNPAMDHIQVPNPSSSILEWTIVDALGKVHGKGASSNNPVSIDVAHYPRGLYLLLSQGGVARFIKE